MKLRTALLPLTLATFCIGAVALPGFAETHPQHLVITPVDTLSANLVAPKEAPTGSMVKTMPLDTRPAFRDMVSATQIEKALTRPVLTGGDDSASAPAPTQRTVASTVAKRATASIAKSASTAKSARPTPHVTIARTRRTSAFLKPTRVASLGVSSMAPGSVLVGIGY
jgi:hypothetical protein